MYFFRAKVFGIVAVKNIYSIFFDVSQDFVNAKGTLLSKIPRKRRVNSHSSLFFQG